MSHTLGYLSTIINNLRGRVISDAVRVTSVSVWTQGETAGVTEEFATEKDKQHDEGDVDEKEIW